jgi:hypothetical protein
MPIEREVYWLSENKIFLHLEHIFVVNDYFINYNIGQLIELANVDQGR